MTEIESALASTCATNPTQTKKETLQAPSSLACLDPLLGLRRLGLLRRRRFPEVVSSRGTENGQPAWLRERKATHSPSKGIRAQNSTSDQLDDVLCLIVEQPADAGQQEKHDET